MIPRKPVAVLATTVGVAVSSCIAACGGPSGAMSQAQAQATYSAIVAPVKASANRMDQAGQDNNIPLLQQEALKAKKDVDAIPGKLQQHDWPSGSAKWDASHIRLIGTKLPVISRCLAAVGQAQGLVEIAAAIQGSSCKQLKSLSG
jgi:hypothetical protein